MVFSSGDFGAFVCGSRRLSGAGLAIVARICSALAVDCAGAFTGCAVGADAAFISGFSAAGVFVAVAAVGGASGAGFYDGKLPRHLLGFSGPVVWWAGGRSGGLVDRLRLRSEFAVSWAASVGCPKVGIGVVQTLARSGSLRSLRFWAARGLPVALWVVDGGSLESLPRWPGGRWQAAAGVFSGSWKGLENLGSSVWVWLPDPALPLSPLPTTKKKKNAVTNKLHIVFCPKYRQRKLQGETMLLVEDALLKKAAEFGVEVVEMALQPDHVHMIVNLPKSVSLSDFVQALKGFSGFIGNQAEGKSGAFWARRYFAVSVSAKSMAAVKKYVKNQR